MTTKKTILILSLLVLGICAMIVLPVAYFTYQLYANYRSDVDTLTSIATELGYVPARQLNFYEARTMISDVLVLAFYATDSLDQFSAKIPPLGFILEYFTPENQSQPADRNNFLYGSVNHGPRDKPVTLNGHYTREDFYGGAPAPRVSTWKLYSPTLQRTIGIKYGRPPTSTDVWLYDGKPLAGNVVVITLYRR